MIEKLSAAWQTATALPWQWKASAIAGGALVLVALIAALVIAIGGDGGSEAAVAVPSPVSASPTPTPTRTLTPTPKPKPTPTRAATPTATAAPTAEPTAAPTQAPTVQPTSPPSPARPVEGAYTLAPVLPGVDFERMVALVPVPGAADEAVVATQGGVLRRISLSGSFSPAQFGDVSGRVIDYQSENEGGLLGLAFSPAYQSDRRVYLYFTSNDGCAGGSPRCDVLSRFRVSGGVLDAASERVMLEVADPYPNHNGGQIVFGPDGYLYAGLGDGGSGGDPQGNGQNLSSALGKILRIDVSGDTAKAPADNPFRDGSGGKNDYIWAYGLRNPWRFTFDRQSGQMWAGDVGQNVWEEVDHIVRGGNYGWKIMEGPECFQAPSCNTSGLRLPRASYSHADGCSITGGYVYRGASMPELKGWYVYADYCSGLVWAVNAADSSAPVLLADTGRTISSFAERPDGELLAITFDRAVYRLKRA